MFGVEGGCFGTNGHLNPKLRRSGCKDELCGSGSCWALGFQKKVSQKRGSLQTSEIDGITKSSRQKGSAERIM